MHFRYYGFHSIKTWGTSFVLSQTLLRRRQSLLHCRSFTLPLCPVHRGNRELELDFKRYWEEFHSSSSEKEKEKALIMTVDAFCKLVKNQADVAQLITKLVISKLEVR
nr:protein SPIRRIG [Ipomoea batatas]